MVSDEGFAEIETVAGIVAGSRWPEQWAAARETADFYDVKADVSGVLSLSGDVDNLRWAPEANDALRPGRSARIYRGDQPLGWLGELHPRVWKGADLPYPALVFELELTSSFRSKVPTFNEISKFPSVRRDIAVIVDEAVTLAKLQENVSVSSSGLLRDLRIFDVYRGAGIDSGRKSVALGLILQDSSRTLTDIDADAVVAAVVARLRVELNATIRDQ
jgi:phenylalanyl-tRNA synthetase beta chain